MRKVFLFIMSIFAYCLSYSQNTYLAPNVQFKARSYDDLSAPLRSVRQAYENASIQLDNYYDSFVENYNSKNYDSALYYVDKMASLNSQFNFKLISPYKLNEMRTACKEQKEKENARTRFSNLLSLLDRKAQEGVYDEKYVAESYAILDELEALNKKYAFVKPEFFTQGRQHVEDVKLENTIVDVNDKCLYKIGSTAPVKKDIVYQTTYFNNDCRLKKITTNTKQIVLEFEYTNHYDNDGWCNISAQTYIVDKRTNVKFTMLYAEGIPVSPGKHYFKNSGESITFKLVFPAIPSSSYYIDLIESEDADWKFYNIKIK